jgi:hypothetical protein
MLACYDRSSQLPQQWCGSAGKVSTERDGQIEPLNVRLSSSRSSKQSFRFVHRPGWCEILDGCRSLMGQSVSAQAERYAMLWGASVLYVLVWHLMGLSGCRVAWLKSQLVEGSTACYGIHAITCSLPRASLPLGSSFRPPVSFSRDDYADANSVPSRSIACMIMASRLARATRALRMLERFEIANAQSFSASGPL